MRKQLAIGLAALLAAASMAGCGSSSGSGTAATVAKTEEETAAETSDSATSETSAPTSGQDSTDKSDVTLTVAIWDKGQQPGLQKIMDDFTAKTGIKTDIQITPYKDYWTMLEAAATGGNLPDVFWMHTFQVATYAQYDDLLMNLSDRANTRKNSSRRSRIRTAIRLVFQKTEILRQSGITKICLMKPVSRIRQRTGHGMISVKTARS